MNMQSHTHFMPNTRRNSGVALVIVLSMIVLLSALMVTFMSRVSTEGRAAKSALQGFEAKQAAETAVNLVISQIRAGTYDKQFPERGWASQPGAIRTFMGGSDHHTYKLYSSDKMIDKGNYKPDATEAGFTASGVFDELPDGFTNMNEPIFLPVQTKNGVAYEAHFPICDPRARNADPDVDGPYLPGSSGIVKGFHSVIVNQPSKNPKRGVDGQEIPILPMNVRWLYQLRDGQLVAATGSGDALNIPNASRTNPPIARIAFWTDDESAKLNLNTSSENTYWDTPSVTSEQESGRITNTGALVNSTRNPSLALAAAQPAANEFQRFPGHPATTSLSPAMRWMFPVKKPTDDGRQYTDLQFKEAIYRLAPRIDGGIGSSMAATRNALNPADKKDYRVYVKDRLLSTVDDYFFRPDRSPVVQDGWYNVFQSVNSSTPEIAGQENAPSYDIKNPYFTAENLERMRFFLTATSRSPELNIFGLPRMSIWPVNYESVASNGSIQSRRQSGYDKLIAFCSTIAGDASNSNVGSKFYFQRENPWSATQDMSTDNARNKVLYDYMMTLVGATSPNTQVGKNHPATGGETFFKKYGEYGIGQIMTTMFDYIRTTNLVDTHNSPKDFDFPLAYTPAYGVSTSSGGIPRGHLGSGQVIPLKIPLPDGRMTKGFGRFPTISEVALVFYHDSTQSPGAGGADMTAGGKLRQDDDAWPITGGAVGVPIRCALAIEMFTPSPGFPNLAEAYAVSVQEDDNAQFTYFPEPSPAPNTPPARMKFSEKSPQINYVEVIPNRSYHGRFFMPTRGFWNQMVYEDGSNTPPPKLLSLTPTQQASPTPDDLYKVYPFISRRFVVSSNGTAPTVFKMRPGKFIIKIHPISHPVTPQLPPFNKRYLANTSEVIQEFEVDFRDAAKGDWTLPVPTAGAGFLQRTKPGDGSSNPLPGDVIRSMEIYGPAQGDYRITAAMPKVKSEYFTAVQNKGNFLSKTEMRIHNLRSSWGLKWAGAVSGKLVQNESPRSDKVAKVASKITQGVQRRDGVGDFDRGISKNTDGPFINKPDEGNTRFNFTDDFTGGGAIPYYRGGGGYEEVEATYFSPNRLVSSAVMFGSLPSGADGTGPDAVRPWETLLFSPGPLNPNKHRGSITPRDHYLLDLFHMPVVEPYAISEPLSTAGRVNINCKLAPFGYAQDPEDYKGKRHDYIERYTGVHGLITGVYQLIVPNNVGQSAHGEQPLTNANTAKMRFRHKLDPAATIRHSFAELLNSKQKNGYFKTASEICEVELLTEAQTGLGEPAYSEHPTAKTFDPKNRDNFWENQNALTGDNQRERPYAHIYPRATTKSNVFTVHVRTQSLAKSPTSDPEKWDESKDSVTGEYRGATTIERYIDPNDKAFQEVDYKDPAKKLKSLEPLYRYRIVNTKTFTVRE